MAARYASLASTPDQEIDLAHLRAVPNSKDRLKAGQEWVFDSEAGSLASGIHTHKDPTSTSPAALGIETTKPRIDYPDLLVALLSLACASLATACVANDAFAWRLGVTYQLVAVGFLLSTMNICLNYILPNVFLPLEARFGSSTLQNYEALLRNKPFASRTDWSWRIVLVLLGLLPLGLSAGYKLFVGGTADVGIERSSGLFGDVFGMYAPPGMQPLGQNTGVTLMFNATTPFVEATTTLECEAYGFNTLVLNTTSTAMLDAPPPAWVNRVRDALEVGESWNISATVTATISTYNSSVEDHRDEYYGPSNSTFWNFYNGQGGVKWSKLYNGWNVGLLTNYAIKTNRDMSWSFIGIVPDPPNDNLTTFAPVAKMYDTVRAPCNGTWTITKGGIQLVDGTCDLPRSERFEQDQLVLRNNQLALPDWYLPILVEFLGPFATVRNESQWLDPSVATMVAGMMWSRVSANNGPGNTVSDRGNGGFRYFDEDAGEWKTTDDAGLEYESAATLITSRRPTLRKSGGLSFLFALQPVVMVAMMAFGLFLRDVPVGKGFGLVAVLAGLNRRPMDILERAAFSGRLKERVGLHIHVLADGDGRGRVSYTIGSVGGTTTTRLQRGCTYR